MIKAIESVYKDIPFRSRLEARWATFFDCINVPAYHEYQGYDLDGIWYLPDFYIPKWKCYFEAKDPGILENENRLQVELPKVRDKTMRLYEQTNYMIIICFGGFRSESNSDFMLVLFPGFNPNIFGPGVFGFGTFGTCNGVDVLYLQSSEYPPATVAAMRLVIGSSLPKETVRAMIEALFPPDQWNAVERHLGELSREDRFALANQIREEASQDYTRQFLIPLHSSVGFNFSMIKDEKQGCRIFAPFSDPLLCNFNAPFFNKFKPYTEAYRAAKQIRFESGKPRTDVL